MPAKKILYVEQNMDGTIGGSHYCLLDIIKWLDRESYKPIAMFYQGSALFGEFSRHCPTFLFRTPRALDLVDRLACRHALVAVPANLMQKSFNLFIWLLPILIREVIFIKTHGIDLVHLNNSIAKGHDWIIACRLSGIKCITHNRRRPRPSRLRRFFAGRFDAVISIAHFIEEDIREKGIDKGSHFIVINDGIDREDVHSRVKRTRNETRRLLNLEKDQPVIGIVGNIKRWKGQEVVIKAVSLLEGKYPQLRCLIIGDVSVNSRADSEYRRSLENLVKEKKLESKILFLGYRDDVPDLIECLDILVHASIAPEPFGRVILEGMVLGKPVIATNFGGPLEIIENGVSGILVPPGDYAATAEAVDLLLADEEKRRNMAAAGLERVSKHFLMDQNIERIQELYEKLLS
jgi:glycosyltransferase involved in cell wall biosynthesis